MGQVLVNGVLLGSQYALLAIGYSLVFGVTRLLTLAHGEVFMLAGIAGVGAMRAFDLPLAAGVLVSLAVGTAAGLITDLLCFRPIRGRDRTEGIAPAVATIGLALVIQNAVVAVQGSDPVGLPADVSGTDIHIGGLLISTAQLMMLVLAIALMAGLHLFVRRTRWGAALRAMGEAPGSVALVGIDQRSLATLTLAVSGLLAGAAGVLVALRVGSVSPFAGLEAGLTGLAVMAIGGMGSLTGAMVAGLGVGVAEAIASYYGAGGFGPAVPWILVVVALLVRPSGLFSSPEGERV